jgi:hypothetical protein
MDHEKMHQSNPRANTGWNKIGIGLSLLVMVVFAGCSGKEQRKAIHIGDQILSKIGAKEGKFTFIRGDDSTKIFAGYKSKSDEKAWARADKIKAIIEQSLSQVAKDESSSRERDYRWVTPFVEINMKVSSKLGNIAGPRRIEVDSLFTYIWVNKKW